MGTERIHTLFALFSIVLLVGAGPASVVGIHGPTTGTDSVGHESVDGQGVSAIQDRDDRYTSANTTTPDPDGRPHQIRTGSGPMGPRPIRRTRAIWATGLTLTVRIPSSVTGSRPIPTAMVAMRTSTATGGSLSSTAMHSFGTSRTRRSVPTGVPTITRGTTGPTSATSSGCSRRLRASRSTTATVTGCQTPTSVRRPRPIHWTPIPTTTEPSTVARTRTATG